MLLWQSLALGKVASSGVLWCPSYSSPVRCGARVVVTTHDATHALFPELYKRSQTMFYSRWYGWCARRAALVITNNETTRRDIIEAYGVPAERLRVVPLAPASHFSPLDGVDLAAVRNRLLQADVPFFLNVGKMSKRRNIPTLIRGFGEFKRRYKSPHRLVLVGKNSEGLDIAAEARAAGVEEEVVHLAFVTDEDLNLLYNACEVFVLVATYEANSLTVIEAQAVGAPTLVADSPGMREMTGEKAAMLPAVEPTAIAETLGALADDAEMRSKIAAQGLAYARQFSWERTARETLAVLAEAAEL